MLAPGRVLRPGTERPAAEDEADDDRAACPFCEGRESATPPETFALGPPGRLADAGGWWVRVVPNKFPAFVSTAPPERGRGGLLEVRPALGNQEVVVHTPRHATSLADLSDTELGLVAEAWQARADAARERGFQYVHALVNQGRAAGASLAHSHSQLVWLPEEPPLAALERRGGEEGCLLCRILAEERGQGVRIVEERDELVLLCPFAGRQPYEMLVAPLPCEADPFTSGRLGAALALAAEGLRRLRAVEGPVPINLWMHAGDHWHIEVLPRLGTLAGLELGAGYYVVTLAPETAAGVLRRSTTPRGRRLSSAAP